MPSPPTPSPRLIRVIAQEIRRDWAKPDPYALPYLNAMFHLSYITESFGIDSASTIILYFLANAHAWRSEVSRRIKAELKSLAQEGHQ
jgi:hypothetical protein